MSNSRIASSCICCGGVNIKRSPAILMPFVANRIFGWEPVEITPEWGLRDVRPGHAYPLCNSIQCSNCGVMFLDIRFSDEEMRALYSGYRDEAYTALRERFEPGYRARNQIYVDGSAYIPQVEQLLAAFVPGAPRVLDWGGDSGLNTPFRSRNSLLHIYDISEKPVIDGALRVDKTIVAATDYDLIVSSNVLEHVPFPVDALREIRAVMNAATVLYIEVPHEALMRSNPGATDLYLKRKHWHEHVNFFSEASLRPLLDASGLEAVHIGELEVIAGGGAAHMLSMVCRRADAPGAQL